MRWPGHPARGDRNAQGPPSLVPPWLSPPARPVARAGARGTPSEVETPFVLVGLIICH